MTWVILVAMAFITFTSRYAFFSTLYTLHISPKGQRFLNFTAPATLTAMWVPIAFMPEGELWVGTSNAYLTSAGVAILLSLLTKRTLLVVFTSMIVFFLLTGLHRLPDAG